MKISQAGIELIKGFEDLRLKAYRDIAGIWTIGWGHTGPDITEGLCISEHEAEVLLMYDISHAERCVNRAVTVALTQGEFDALVSFVFNVGPGRKRNENDPGRDGFVTLRNGNPSTLLRKLNGSDYDGAALELLRWNKASGKEYAGLTRRRHAEQELFESTA